MWKTGQLHITKCNYTHYIQNQNTRTNFRFTILYFSSSTSNDISPIMQSKNGPHLLFISQLKNPQVLPTSAENALLFHMLIIVCFNKRIAICQFLVIILQLQ